MWHVRACKGNTFADDEDDEEEEPSSLSLAERVRLFTQKIEQQNRPKVIDTPVQKRTVRRQVTSTRFRTLPVTDAEVEGISPLVACFSKQPDPAKLGQIS
jgi:glutamate/tyrosine decarboxylase-like PLP-dependent enzyme